jgi:NADPH:quinone reductase-like Zn-dependent oxidoreductase
MMKAMLIDGYGGVDMLRPGEADLPVPAAGEILIRIESIGVNPADGKWRSGMFAQMVPLGFPHILGYDVAGIVEAGDGIPAGTRVAAMLDAMKQGAYAGYACSAARGVAIVPESLDPDVAAAVPTPGLTGVQMIEEQLDVRPGDRVLITGAVGAVGRFALHAAHERGCEIVAAVRASHRAEALSLGADTVLILGEDAWVGAPFDAVADTLGGAEVAALCRHVKPGGLIRTVATTPIPAEGLPTVPEFFGVRSDGARLAALLRAVARGEIPVPVARTLPLEQAAEAQRALEAGGVGGKIVLKP